MFSQNLRWISYGKVSSTVRHSNLSVILAFEDL